MKYFAVLDTETNWNDKVMSIGIVLADAQTFKPIRGKYLIIEPAYKKGGMYESVLFSTQAKLNRICYYKEAMKDICAWLDAYDITQIYAYNAKFDYYHLPELHCYKWFDILRIAAYKPYNFKIDETMSCFKTGRLKRHYGVEPILQLLSGNADYREVHNALCDAVDELKIMQYLNLPLETYEIGSVE
ncbi:MAG: hypothetical protein KBT48_03095 [Firmicutes bacterium]|nr:hypothetical protein [Bacillota bacterium]